MTTDQVNYLNIGLMVLSGIVAVFLPFELFLFSYVVLGPLHYLTEISWLNKRQYFVPSRRDIWLLVILFMVMVLPAMYKLLHGNHAAGQYDNGQYHTIQSIARMAIFVAFGASAVLVFTRSAYQRTAAITLVIIIGFLFRTQQFILVLFALFLPTLIHVFVFTGAFILAGALKSRSFSGVLSILVFICCAAALFLVYPNAINSSGKHIMNAYDKGFYVLNKQIFSTFLHQKVDHNEAFRGTGILITRFIAYAYTYHYLNWFSKTSVIKWHLIPKRSMALLIGAWAAAEVLYFTSYLTGLAVLYFLSLLHVVLEFPLNIHSIKDIVKETRVYKLSDK